MSVVVIDASVAAKWYFPEPHSEQALQLLQEDNNFIAPDLLYTEFASVVWKRRRAKTLSEEDAARMLEQVVALPIEIVPSAPLLPTAWQIAVSHDRTMYDSLYLALALLHDCVLLTGDQRVVNSLADTKLKSHVKWIGSL